LIHFYKSKYNKSSGRSILKEEVSEE